MMSERVNRVLNSVLFPIKDNILFFTFMYLLGAICIIFEPLAWYGSRLWSLLELFIDTYFLCLFICLFPKKVKGVVKAFLYIILYVVAIIDMTCYVRLGMGILPIYYQTFVQSNLNETTEMLETYLSTSIILSPLLLILVLLLLHIIVACKKKNISFSFKTAYSRPIKILATVLLLCSLVLSYGNKKYFFYRVICQTSELDFQEKYDMTPATGFYIPIYRLAYSISEYNSLKHVTKTLRKTLNKHTVDSCQYTCPDIVLIIGESYNRSHSQLYGYPLPTTPYQNTLYKTGKLVPFTNVITSWNMTCESFEDMFSLYAVGDKGNWYDYPFFTTMFRQAGYNVFFLSNQFVMNPSESFSAFIEDIFINDKEISELQFSHRNENIHPYDMGLLDDYQKMKKLSSAHNLWIFHTMGLHAKFSERYPSEWKKFTLADYHRPDLSEEQLEELTDYDNAILYNDYFLNAIINAFKDKETVLVFLSDHGERVFDNSAEFGRNLSWNANDIKQQFEIPFWLYFTDAYCEKHPDIVKTAIGVSNKRYMTDILSHTLINLAGIRSKYYQPRYDILNPAYHEKRKRIIRNQRDFDTI